MNPSVTKFLMDTKMKIHPPPSAVCKEIKKERLRQTFLFSPVAYRDLGLNSIAMSSFMGPVALFLLPVTIPYAIGTAVTSPIFFITAQLSKSFKCKMCHKQLSYESNTFEVGSGCFCSNKDCYMNIYDTCNIRDFGICRNKEYSEITETPEIRQQIIDLKKRFLNDNPELVKYTGSPILNKSPIYDKDNDPLDIDQVRSGESWYKLSYFGTNGEMHGDMTPESQRIINNRYKESTGKTYNVFRIMSGMGGLAFSGGSPLIKFKMDKESEQILEKLMKQTATHKRRVFRKKIIDEVERKFNKYQN